ncbi:hypothetical protein FYL37_15975, partial [Agathobacter rectalis]
MSRRKIDQAKLQYWAGMIHDCQHSGLKTKEWLANHGISKDSSVDTACSGSSEEIKIGAGVLDYISELGNIQAKILEAYTYSE